MSLSQKLQKILKFKGPVTATVSPFNGDGSIRVESIQQYASHLKRIGVKGVYVHGSTGEGLSLTNDEKMTLSRKWIQESRSNNLLGIMNVSSTCVPESLKNAQLCDELQADAIAVLPPIYYRPRNARELVKYLELIALSAPNTPLVYYHIPSFTHVDVNLIEFVEEALKAIPSFAGMKYTSTDIVGIQSLQMRFDGKIKIFMGFEETLLPGLCLGVDAAVCGFFNVKSCTKAYLTMLEEIERNVDKAREQQDVIASKVAEVAHGDYVLFYKNVREILEKESEGRVVVGKPRPPVELYD